MKEFVQTQDKGEFTPDVSIVEEESEVKTVESPALQVSSKVGTSLPFVAIGLVLLTIVGAAFGIKYLIHYMQRQSIEMDRIKA